MSPLVPMDPSRPKSRVSTSRARRSRPPQYWSEELKKSLVQPTVRSSREDSQKHSVNSSIHGVNDVEPQLGRRVPHQSILPPHDRAAPNQIDVYKRFSIGRNAGAHNYSDAYKRRSNGHNAGAHHYIDASKRLSNGNIVGQQQDEELFKLPAYRGSKQNAESWDSQGRAFGPLFDDDRVSSSATTALPCHSPSMSSRASPDKPGPWVALDKQEPRSIVENQRASDDHRMSLGLGKRHSSRVEDGTNIDKRHSSRTDDGMKIDKRHSSSSRGDERTKSKSRSSHRRHHRKSQESATNEEIALDPSGGKLPNLHHQSTGEYARMIFPSPVNKQPSDRKGTSLITGRLSTSVAWNDDNNTAKDCGNNVSEQGSKTAVDDNAHPEPENGEITVRRSQLEEAKVTVRRSSLVQTKTEPPDPQWVAVFDLLKIDGELHRDLLPHALLLTCNHNPDPQWIIRALHTIPGGCTHSTIDLTQFCAFLRNYIVIERKAAQKEFSCYDVNGDGTVDKKELAVMLKAMGIEPLPEVLDEVLLTVDLDGSGDLSVDEFLKVLRLMKNSGGFTESESKNLRTVFKKYDKDGSGEIDVKELEQMLAWLGYPVTSQTAAQLVRDVDSDKSGSLCEVEFMLVMRRFRDGEIGTFKKAFAAYSKDGFMQTQDLPAVFAQIGYPFLFPGVLDELRRDVGVAEGPLDFDSAWRMVHLFRARDGHARDELVELQQVFKRFATSQTSFQEDIALGEVELGLALRWLGFSPWLTWLQDLITENDSDGSLQLELTEFLKLMRRLREVEIQEVQSAFAEEATNDTLPVTMLRGILTDLNYEPSLSLLKPIIKEYGEPRADFQTFLRLIDKFRQAARPEMRKHMGFDAIEVYEFEKKFATYNKSGNGLVGGRELAHLLQELSPAAAYDKNARRKIQKVLEEVDSDHDGMITFDEYLKLMQMHGQKTAKNKLEKEHKAAHNVFSRTEVRDLREIYHAYCDPVYVELTQEDLRALLSRILRLGEGCPLLSSLEHLAESFDEDKNGMLDFPEFLMLLRHLQEVNFGKINDIAAAMAEKVGEEEEKELEGERQLAVVELRVF